MDPGQNLVPELAPDAIVLLDDFAAGPPSEIPAMPGVSERLRQLETERQAAFSQMQRMVSDIATLRKGHARWLREFETVQADALYRLALLAEYRSGGGGGKVLRIGVMAALLADALGADGHFCESLQAAAPLHDIGEIMLPDSLMAGGELDDIGRDLMRGHCRVGHALLADSNVPEIRLAAEIALGHHERFDGSGYPAGLAGADIPLANRIVAVVDVFDALTSRRPWRPAYSVATALEMITSASGSLFDPAVIAVFREIIEGLLAVRWLLDDNNPRPEAMRWLGRPPEMGLWRRFR